MKERYVIRDIITLDYFSKYDTRDGSSIPIFSEDNDYVCFYASIGDAQDEIENILTCDPTISLELVSVYIHELNDPLIDEGEDVI